MYISEAKDTSFAVCKTDSSLTNSYETFNMSSPFKKSLVVSHSGRPCLSAGLNHQAIFLRLSAWITRLQKSYPRDCLLPRCCCCFWVSWVTGACRTEKCLQTFAGQEVLWANLGAARHCTYFLDLAAAWHIVVAPLSQGGRYQQALE